MHMLLKKSGLPLLCILCLGAAGCTTQPPRSLYVEPAVSERAAETTASHYDVSYAIDCHIMKKKRSDFISFKINTMLYAYRLDFIVQQDIKHILEDFFRVSEIARTQHKKNGRHDLGSSTLYAYALLEDSATRLIVQGRQPNYVDFSFLLQDGEQYLVIEGFQAQTLEGSLKINSYIDGIPIRYDDIKKAYDFFNDEQALESLRIKQQQLPSADTDESGGSDAEIVTAHEETDGQGTAALPENDNLQTGDANP